MTERRALGSFIVRIYRIDTDDRRKIMGLLEPMDGSGGRKPFTDIDELGVILARSVARRLKGRKKRAEARDL